ncbi:transglutaminase domain protein [Thioalkalivibrio sp. K90mix]|uniref:transglutaminase TgpA family protein n=1 Tax=Thioalkalivibrio sp. (strain K90mix) TaxID=396595 RepID=UPI0001C4E1FF|nr:DUF3488 and transglutaminase-like domain-containing protein [Thioalkalivibrio sp. K90mix]ADC71833.1 transglutaminase domain protein [Thioalkalivibrio sp. K90mix]
MNRSSRQHLPELRGLELALLALPVAALPHAWHQPLWVTLLVAAAILLRSWLHLRDRKPPSIGLMALLAAFAGGLTFLQYGTLFGQEAGTALLLVMMALKLLETRNRRDIVIGLFLGYFVVVTTYFFDQSMLIAAWSLLSAWLLTAALVQVHAGRPLERRRLAKHSGWMMVHAFPFMLILFVAFPRVQGPLWGDPQRDEVATTALSGELNPGDIAELLQDETTTMRVQFHGSVPPPRAQYWRALVMTDFDGRRWQAEGGQSSIELPQPGDSDRVVAYTATLEPTRMRYLPVLDYPVALPDNAEYRDNHQVVRDRRIVNRIQYDAEADLTRPPGAGEALSRSARERALELPPSAAPRARAEVALWRATHGDDDRAIIQAALDRFAAAPYRYTLQPPTLEGDVTDQFLFETQAGYCEHYASAFAVLMRSAGIPTRVVTGYQGGEWMQRGEYLRLRNADAHAWNEVWLDGEGWIRVDPTAAIAPERIEAGIGGLTGGDGEPMPDFLRRDGLGWVQQLRFGFEDWRDFARFRWESWVLAFDPERQRELFARFGLDATDWRDIVTALGVGFGLLAAVALVWSGWRRPRRQLEVPDRLLHRLSRRIERQQTGLGRRPHEPVITWTRRVKVARPDLAPLVDAFAEHYNRVRFAPARPDDRARHLTTLRRLAASDLRKPAADPPLPRTT